MSNVIQFSAVDARETTTTVDVQCGYRISCHLTVAGAYHSLHKLQKVGRPQWETVTVDIRFAHPGQKRTAMYGMAKTRDRFWTTEHEFSHRTTLLSEADNSMISNVDAML